MKNKLSLFLLLVLLLSLLSGCGGKEEKFSAYSFDYFDTVTTVTGHASSQEDFDRVSGEILALLGEYHRLYTIYTRYEGMENLCTVNELVDGAHRVVKVDERILDLLAYAKEMYALTKGKTNIAMGSVLRLWHDCREAGTSDPSAAALPPLQALADAAEHTDIDCVVIDREAGTVWLSDPQMTLDVGAVAKGYAVEMVARAMAERGISGYVLNVGGNVRAVGEKPNGEAWRAGVQNPDGESDVAYLAYVDLRWESLVTSGSYQRYYVVDGKRYHHIIDPATLMPCETFASVSVLSRSSADGDVLSTALFCMTLEEGLSLVASLDGVEAMWVLADGSIVQTDGFPKGAGM